MIPFKLLTVELSRSGPTHVWQGRVMQQNSEGFVYGRNLLSKRGFTRLDSAQAECKRILKDKTKKLDFRVVCE